MFFYFLLELRTACQLPVTGSLSFPIVLTTERTLITETIVKTRDSGYEIENEVTNSETLNSQTFFSQAFCKVASFPLVLDLMHECYVISLPDVFHFLIWRNTCFAAYFHILTSQKPRGNETGIQFLTLRTRENNEKLKHLPTNKTLFISNFWCAKTLCSNRKNLIWGWQSFSVKTWTANVIKLSSS